MRKLFRTFSFLVLMGLLGGGTVIGLFLFFITKGLPDVNKLKLYQHSNATEVYSGDTKKIGEFLTERRYPVRFEQIPIHVIRAFVAAEDSKFFEHKGIDFVGIGRAVISNLLRGRYAQGGSTITQQVARSILLATRKKELTRKIREMILAWQMEQTLSKNEILNLYLSEIYLGHGAFGIGAAARNYFNKRVEDLTLAEGAILAGLPQRPNEWDPFRNPHMSKRRQGYVLSRMVEEKYITPTEAQEAHNQTLKLYRVEEMNAKAAPYFTEYVRQHLMSKYGSEAILSRGFKVTTTVRFDLQKVAEKALDRGLRQVDKRLGWRGPLRNLKTPEEVLQFRAQTHENTLEKKVRVHLFPPKMDGAEKRLPFDLSSVQYTGSPYFGTTPLEEGDFNLGVVSAIDEKAKEAKVWVGQTETTLPWASANWVTAKTPSLRNLQQVLKVGDVIHIKVDKFDRKVNRIFIALEQEPEIQGALLSYDIATGAVLAMVGGTDFAKSQFNRVLQAKRQVGSTFKPIIYAAALDKGFSPSSVVTDAPIVFKHEGGLDADSQGEAWKPHNYSDRFEGEIPLRLALIRSMNIPTVKILNEITVDYGIEYARKLGITAPLPRDLTIGLGSWSSSLEELMRAYAVFPRLGKPVVLRYIQKVEDGAGQILESDADPVPAKAEVPSSTTLGTNTQIPVASTAGALAAEKPPENPNALCEGCVISPQTAYVMTDMLKAVVREGTGHAALIGGAVVAGKTGTSNDHRDAWFVGYTPQVVTGVWVGYDKDRPLDIGETGGRASAPIWNEYMQAVIPTYPKADFAIPDDIVFAYVDRDTGRLASSQSAHRTRVAFKAGTVPNLAGDNLPRIGEPGVRGTTGEPDANAEVPLSNPSVLDAPPPPEGPSGYQE